MTPKKNGLLIVRILHHRLVARLVRAGPALLRPAGGEKYSRDLFVVVAVEKWETSPR